MTKYDKIWWNYEVDLIQKHPGSTLFRILLGAAEASKTHASGATTSLWCMEAWVDPKSRCLGIGWDRLKPALTLFQRMGWTHHLPYISNVHQSPRAADSALHARSLLFYFLSFRGRNMEQWHGGFPAISMLIAYHWSELPMTRFLVQISAFHGHVSKVPTVDIPSGKLT
jgi:hypothetical protein